LVLQAHPVQPVLKVLLELLVHRVHQALQDHRVHLVFRGIKVHLVFRGIKVHQGLLALRGQLDLMGFQV
jgi:hypothetical protein